MVKRLPAMRETWVPFLGREEPLEKEMATTPVSLPGKSHGQRSPISYSPWGRKESDMTERLHFTLHYFSSLKKIVDDNYAVEVRKKEKSKIDSFVFV